MRCSGASAVGRGRLRHDWQPGWRMVVLLSLSWGRPSQSGPLGVLQKHQSRALSGLAGLQLGLQPERQRSCLEVAGQRASVARCGRCDGAEQRRAWSLSHHLDAPAEGRWRGSGSGLLPALRGVLGPLSACACGRACRAAGVTAEVE